MHRKANKRFELVASANWLWLVLSSATKQVVACVIGGRGVATCRQLWKAVPDAFNQGICFTGFWEAYQVVIPKTRCYRAQDEQHQAVGKDSGLTAHVERFNNTIRQRLARFVRKTLSFSKSDQMHLIILTSLPTSLQSGAGCYQSLVNHYRFSLT